jgi:hypothetical protein
VIEAISKPHLIIKPKGGIIFKPRLCQQFPAIGNLKAQIVIPVSNNLHPQNLFKFIFFLLNLLQIIVGIVTPVQPNFPTAISNIPDHLLNIFDIVPESFMIPATGQEIEAGFCPVLCLQLHDLLEIKEW